MKKSEKLLEEQMFFDGNGFDREKKIEEAVSLIQSAGSILNSMGPELERIAWILEDTLMYIDEIEQRKTDQKAFISSDLSLEDQVKLIRKK